MGHGCNLFLQRNDIFALHVFHNDKRKSTLAEIFQQKILAGDRVHAVRQIVEHIVVDACGLHADDRRNEKHQRSDQNRYVKLDNKFPKFHKIPSLCLLIILF